MLNSIDIDIYLRDEKKCVQQKQNLKFFRSRFFRISSSSSVVLSDCQLLASFFVDEWKQTKKKIFSLQTKKKVNPNEFEITALLFLTFLLCLVYLFIYFFSHCCCCFCWLVEKRVSVVRERMFLLLLMSKCVLSMDTLQ